MLSLPSALYHQSKLSDSSYPCPKPSLPDISSIVDLYPEFFPYLTGHQLAQCTRVSKAWNHYLNDHITNPWKTAFLTDFCLPHFKSSKEEHYKTLYGKRIFCLKNIQNNQPTKTINIEIETRTEPSYLCINNRLVVATGDKILIYNALGYLEKTLASFPSNASSTFLRQNKGSNSANSEEQPLTTPNRDWRVFPAGGDLFFSHSGKIVCLWEASTGNCLFAITDFIQYSDKKPSFIDNKIIYTTERLELITGDDLVEIIPHSLVEVWDVRELKLLATFKLPVPSHNHYLSDDILISENGRNIFGYSLASNKKLFHLKMAENEITQQNNSLHLTMKIVNSQLLVYFPGVPDIQIHDINDGKLVSTISCGILVEIQPFHCFENRYLICSKEKFALEVWDLKSGIRLKTLVQPHTLSFSPPAPLITIHHNRLVARYRDHSSSYLMVWNLHDFSLLISKEYTRWNTEEAAFIDDYILNITVKIEDSLFSFLSFQRILFWDILTGKFLGSRDQKVDDIRVHPDHQKGKLLTFNGANVWFKKGEGFVRTTKFQWTFEDFTLEAKAKPQSKVQRIAGTVLQPFIDLLGFFKGTRGLSA